MAPIHTPDSNPKAPGANQVQAKLQLSEPKKQHQTESIYRSFSKYIIETKPSPASNEQDDLDETPEQIEMTKRAAVKNQKIWHRRMKLLFFCLGYKQHKDSIADVARSFAEVYSGLNVPTTDIAAGFVLLSKYQEAQRKWVVKEKQFGIERYLSGIPITRDSRFLDVSNAYDSHLLNDLIHYLSYSMAIFGWPLNVIHKPYTLCSVVPHLRCCWPSRNGRPITSKQPVADQSTTATISDNDPSGPTTTDSIQQQQADQRTVGQLDEEATRPIILEDNFCGCNAATAEKHLARNNYDIIYINYKVDVYVTPFLVAADHSKRTIVVAVRGSMCLADMMTDLSGQTIKFPLDNCPDDWLSHRGMTSAAEYVCMRLIDDQILKRAFNSRPDLGSQEYQLVLCGHSLGAGVAAILGILLRKRNLYPNLRAFLYSPPGGILSLPAVEYSKQFAIGITLGSDVVARLGVAQFGHLRYYTLLSLKESQLSKRKVLTRALCPLASACFGSNEVEYDPTSSMNVLHGSNGKTFTYKGCKIPYQAHSPTLHVPGRLINVVRDFEFSRNGTPIYRALWTDNADYDKILIYEGMVFDHLPQNLYSSMKMLFSRTVPVRRDSASEQASEAVSPTNSTSTCTWQDHVQQTTRHRDSSLQADIEQDQQHPDRAQAKKHDDDDDTNGNSRFFDANSNQGDNGNNKDPKDFIADKLTSKSNNNNNNSADDNGNYHSQHLSEKLNNNTGHHEVTC